VILDPEQLIQGYPFFARRHRRVPMCDPAAVHACCQQATELAQGAPEDEPAAVFFAFADRRRAFPFAWKLMAGYVAMAQARLNHHKLRATQDELDQLCRAVLYRQVSWPEVRAWFQQRLVPLGERR
jgi:hypothetical protein